MIGIKGYIDKVEYIVIHESLSSHGKDVSARTIHQWHLENGWAGIGYHYFINEYGDVENGRPEFWPGSHVKGWNEESIGICLSGRGPNFNDEQWGTLRRLVLELKRRYPDAEIVGHRDLDENRTCPSFSVRKWCKQQGII